MGLRNALARESSDFRGISPNPGLYVDKIIQKTIFQLTEEGIQNPSSVPLSAKCKLT